MSMMIASKPRKYKVMTEEVPSLHDQTAHPGPDHLAMSSLPQADPGYGYDQGKYGQQETQSQTNVIQVQPCQQAATTIIQTGGSPPGSPPDMAGYIGFSCFVFWCCSPLFGCIAFLIALSGYNAQTPSKAKCLGRASLVVNIIGIKISVILGSILLALYFTNNMTYKEDNYDDLDNNNYNNYYSG